MRYKLCAYRNRCILATGFIYFLCFSGLNLYASLYDGSGECYGLVLIKDQFTSRKFLVHIPQSSQLDGSDNHFSKVYNNFLIFFVWIIPVVSIYFSYFQGRGQSGKYNRFYHVHHIYETILVYVLCNEDFCQQILECFLLYQDRF